MPDGKELDDVKLRAHRDKKPCALEGLSYFEATIAKDAGKAMRSGKDSHVM